MYRNRIVGGGRSWLSVQPNGGCIDGPQGVVVEKPRDALENQGQTTDMAAMPGIGRKLTSGQPECWLL
jgi:hypothetical protein